MTVKWRIVANPFAVTGLSLVRVATAEEPLNPIARRAERELRDYLGGRLRSFSVDYDITSLSRFTQTVLRETAKIPYGQTRSYRWLAARLGKPKAARAVGNALARNPVPIIIPCHRVLRSDGSIGPFVFGTEWKKRLLELEKCFVKTKASSRNPR